MSGLTASKEDYIKAIDALNRGGQDASITEIAGHLSGSTKPLPSCRFVEKHGFSTTTKKPLVPFATGEKLLRILRCVP